MVVRGESRWSIVHKQGGLSCGHPSLRSFMPSKQRTGCGLSRRAWTRLNRLWTRVVRFGANKLRWGDSCCDWCQHTADHITCGPCPIYRPPEGINGLIDLDYKHTSMARGQWLRYMSCVWRHMQEDGVTRCQLWHHMTKTRWSDEMESFFFFLVSMTHIKKVTDSLLKSHSVAKIITCSP